MGTAAILQYYTHKDGVVVVLLTASEPPILAEIGWTSDGRPVTASSLLDRVTRLQVDAQGLPPDWDAPGRKGRYRRALGLPPAVNAAKRSGPMLQRRLHNPAYGYGTEYLEELGACLIPEALRPRLTGCDVLCVVPHGALHSIPFAVLRWDSETRVGDRFGVCQVPSASLLPLLQARNQIRDAAAVRGRTCLAAAVAAVEDEDPAEFEADATMLAAVLKDNGGSVTRLAGVSGPSAASKKAVMAASPVHDIVHLACHGVFLEAADDAMETSGLLLSDGNRAPDLASFTGAVDRLPQSGAGHFLSARDVLGLSLNAELVTLRACSSGRSDVRSGDELLGLVRAFLYAGTPSLLASLWNVNKASSRQLLEYFYRAWLGPDGMPKWQALRQAQRALRDVPEYNHPYHWGPFVLIGDWL